MWDDKSAQVNISSYLSLVSLNSRCALPCLALPYLSRGWTCLRHWPVGAGEGSLSGLWTAMSHPGPSLVCVQGSAGKQGRRDISLGASSNKDSVLSGLGPTFMVLFNLNCSIRVLPPSIVRSEG